MLACVYGAYVTRCDNSHRPCAPLPALGHLPLVCKICAATGVQQRVGLPGRRELGDSGGVRGAEVPERVALGAAEQVFPHVSQMEVAEPCVPQRVTELEGEGGKFLERFAKK